MLTFWPLVVLILIAIAVVLSIAEAVVSAKTRAIYDAAEKVRKAKDVTLDAMAARVTATGWHFALERDRDLRLYFQGTPGFLSKRSFMENSFDTTAVRLSKAIQHSLESRWLLWIITSTS